MRTEPSHYVSSLVRTPEGVAVAGVILENVDPCWRVEVSVIDPVQARVRRRGVIGEQSISGHPLLSPDGKRLVFVHNNALCLYDTRSGKKTLSIPVKEPSPLSFAFAPDSKSVAYPDHEGAICIHDTATGKLKHRLRHAGDRFAYITFSPDGGYLATRPPRQAGKKEEVSLWDLRGDKEIQRWSPPSGVRGVVFSPDSKRLAVGSYGGLLLYDVQTGQEARRLSAHDGACDVAFSPDGKLLAGTTFSGVIRLWDAATGKLLPSSADVDLGYVTNLRFSPDGKQLQGSAGAVLAWEPKDGRELHRYPEPAPGPFQPSSFHRCLRLSPDAKLLAAHGPDDRIHLWSAATGKEVRVLKRPRTPLWDLLFTADGRWIVSTGDDQKVRVWDVASGRQLHSLPGQRWLAVSPDSRWLAVEDPEGSGLLLYDLASGGRSKRISIPPQWEMPGLAFSSDSRLFAVAACPSSNEVTSLIEIWDVSCCKRIKRLDRIDTSVRSLAFSSDGRTLATGSRDGELRLWEVASGQRRHAFKGHEDTITSLVFSPDGRTLAAASSDAPVYVWDVTQPGRPPRLPLSDQQLQRSWTALADPDAVAAFHALNCLAAAPEQSLPLLRHRLVPVAHLDPQHVRRLIDALDSDEFAERQNATAELKKLGDAVFLPLCKALEGQPGLEVRRRLQGLIERLEPLTPERLRQVRNMELLERLGTDDARKWLEELARGDPGARLTSEAAAACARLHPRTQP